MRFIMTEKLELTNKYFKRFKKLADGIDKVNDNDMSAGINLMLGVVYELYKELDWAQIEKDIEIAVEIAYDQRILNE